ncbi:MAG: M50 family metallopeptidase, partial [Kiritimatiellia bacterium]|nr:M50 family metallopeptidase [Kiritimatiellia bacterium]
MFGSAYRIATVWGIPIKMHMSWIIILFMIPGTLLFRVSIALGLFVSVALHELGHSFVAIHKGCRVREITLMFMGGAAQMERIPRRPLDETLMALAGPAVSLALGFLFWFAGDLLPLPIYAIASRGGIVEANVVQIIGAINWSLAGFNLLPSFPMDGGRVFRALLTPKLGRLRATFIAARLGKIMAVLFGLYGFLGEPRSWIL